MTHSPDLDKLAAALSAFQGALKPVTRNATGDSGMYADLPHIRTQTRRLLAKHGLAIVQSGGYDVIETTILHTSGQWLTLSAKCETSASGETKYAQRHAFMLAAGVVEAPEPPKPIFYDTKNTVLLDAAGIIERNRQLMAQEPR